MTTLQSSLKIYLLVKWLICLVSEHHHCSCDIWPGGFYNELGIPIPKAEITRDVTFMPSKCFLHYILSKLSHWQPAWSVTVYKYIYMFLRCMKLHLSFLFSSVFEPVMFFVKKPFSQSSQVMSSNKLLNDSCF